MIIILHRVFKPYIVTFEPETNSTHVSRYPLNVRQRAVNGPIANTNHLFQQKTFSYNSSSSFFEESQVKQRLFVP
jgi:hypothetical protein